MKKYVKALLLLISTCLNIQISFAATTYNVTVKGQKAGRAVLSINQLDKDYQVKLSLYPVLLAKMFGIGDMTESASGVVRKGHLYPKIYLRTDKKGEKLLSVDFANDIARIDSKKDGQKTLSIDTLGQDPLSQMAQIRFDLQNNVVKSTYYLVTDNSQQRYRAVQEGKKVTLTQHPSKSRQLVLWFNDAYELIKMQKNKKGKIQFFMNKAE